MKKILILSVLALSALSFAGPGGGVGGRPGSVIDKGTGFEKSAGSYLADFVKSLGGTRKISDTQTEIFINGEGFKVRSLEDYSSAEKLEMIEAASALLIQKKKFILPEQVIDTYENPDKKGEVIIEFEE